MQENLVQRTSTHGANGVNERGTAIHFLWKLSVRCNFDWIWILENSFLDKHAKDGTSSSGANIPNGERPSVETSSSTTVTMSSREKYEAKKSIVILIAIFLISLIAMFYVYLSFPELEAYVFIWRPFSKNLSIFRDI